MEVVEQDIVIVGAGLAGLSTSLGLHRFQLSSLDHPELPPREVSLEQPNFGKYESRCIKRGELLETMVNELLKGTIRYSSKVVSIEESGHFKLVHLADGCVIQAKVLIGCDGVNSVVGKWLGLPKPVSVGRSAVRGLVHYSDPHGFEPQFHAHFGGGVRFGYVPCDPKSVYWFCTVNPSTSNWHEDMADSPAQMKEFVLSKISSVANEVSEIVEKTNLDSISCAELKMRMPWDILLKETAKGNVCVAGDALHPMTPDIGQGGCSSLEDGVILARCIGEAFKMASDGDEEMAAIYKGVEKYVSCRKWRSFSLISAARVVGLVQESDNVLVRFLRVKFLSKYTIATMIRMSDYDCGKLDAF